MESKISISNKVILIISILFMLLSTTGYAITRIIQHEGKIVDGVLLKNIDIGNKSKEDLEVTFQQIEESLKAKTISIKYKNKNWPLKLNEAEIKINKDEIYKEAYNIGRQGNWFEQLKDRKRIATYKKQITLKVDLNEKIIISQVRKRAKELIIKPVNADYRITSDYKLSLIPGKNGVDIDSKSLVNQVNTILIDDITPEIELKLRIVKPNKSNEDILNMKVNGVVASFTTEFNAAKVSRSFNVIRGTKSLDNTVIKPNETFSFNKTVGPRNKRNGYKEAPEIRNNTLVNGVGGGICQVSTTLFNAVLLANLKVVERSNHSIPVHYAPLGRDATVSYGGRDFKFKNNTDGYLIIKTKNSKNRITFLLLGNVKNKKRVDLSEKTLYTISPKTILTKKDNNLYIGQQVVEQKPNVGYRVKVIQTVWSKNKIIKRVVFYSTYNPQNKIVRIGTKKRPKATPKKVVKKEPAVNQEEDEPQIEEQLDPPSDPSA